MCAVHHRSIPDIKALIKSSANVNTTMRGGHAALTVLLQASQDNSPASLQALKLLVEASADCNAVLTNGDSALALAIKCSSSRLLAIERESNRTPLLYVAFMNSEALVLLRNGARVSQKEVHLAVDLNLPNVARHLLTFGGSFSETLAYVNMRQKSFYGEFLYPSAVLVSRCKIPHLSSIPKLPKLAPLHPLQPPLRAKTLCIGGLLLHLLLAFAKHVPQLKRVFRSRLPCLLLPVVHRCTGLAAVICIASASNLSHGFVQVDPDFDIKNRGNLAFSWLPERCKEPPHARQSEPEEAGGCACKCALM
jgi:hypothetical protein